MCGESHRSFFFILFAFITVYISLPSVIPHTTFLQHSLVLASFPDSKFFMSCHTRYYPSSKTGWYSPRHVSTRFQSLCLNESNDVPSVQKVLHFSTFPSPVFSAILLVVDRHAHGFRDICYNRSYRSSIYIFSFVFLLISHFQYAWFSINNMHLSYWCLPLAVFTLKTAVDGKIRIKHADRNECHSR